MENAKFGLQTWFHSISCCCVVVVIVLLLPLFPCALMIKFDGGEGGCGTCWTLVLPHTEHTQSHGQPRKAMSLPFVSVSKKTLPEAQLTPQGIES